MVMVIYVNRKKNEDKFSRWRTPLQHGKYIVDLSFTCILDLIFSYILRITCKHLPFILLWSSFVQRPRLQTVSNACWKSIKQQNSLLLLFFAKSIRLLIINILSTVECFSLKPACCDSIRLNFSAKLFNLLLIISVNNLPRQLSIVIGR